MSERIKIVRLVQTSVACPSQWDAETDDGRQVYIRFRFGEGSVRVAPIGDRSEYAAVYGEEIAWWQGEHDLDGDISEADMMAKTADAVDWSGVGGSREGASR